MVVANTPTQLFDTDRTIDMPLRIEAFGATDTGLERDNNEDAFGFDEGLGIFVVCDGMGGHAAGEIASSLAVETVLDEFEKRHEITPMAANDSDAALPVIQQSALRSSVRRAHNAIAAAQAESVERHGMGTTLAALKITHEDILVAHVGDSRVYRWRRDTGLTRATRDHSLFNRMIDDRLIPADSDEKGFDQRNIIMRALGTRDYRAEINTVERRAGDVFILCSDGLSDMIGDAHIEHIVDFYEGDPERTTQALIQAANDAGGHDNVTVLVVRLQAERPSEKYNSDDVDTMTDPQLQLMSGMGAASFDDDVEWMTIDEAMRASRRWTHFRA